MKKLKPEYKQIGNSIICGLDFALTCISKILLIHFSILFVWYAFIGVACINGTIPEPIPKIDYEWLKVMYVLNIVCYIFLYYTKKIFKEFRGLKDTELQSKGNKTFDDYREYLDLVGRCFYYSGSSYKIFDYKRVVTITNEKQYSSEIIFEVGRFQEDGLVYPIVWTKDELYMALAKDESFQ